MVLTLIIVVNFAPYSSALILPSDTFPTEGTYSVTGGTTILMEEYTATWCDICQITDPKLDEISIVNKDRIALVALHPMDGVDLIGNTASNHRISSTALAETDLTPSFMFDGGLEREGSVELKDIQSELLEAENMRKSYSKLELNLSITNSIKIILELKGYNNLTNTILTVMLTENNVAGNTALSLDEVETYDRVLRALFMANLTILSEENSVILAEDYETFGQFWGDDIQPTMSIQKYQESVILEINLQIPIQWNLGEIGIIGAHERIDEQSGNVITTLGAVQILQFDIVEKENSNLWIIFLIVMLATGFALAYVDKYLKK